MSFSILSNIIEHIADQRHFSIFVGQSPTELDQRMPMPDFSRISGCYI